MMGSIERMVPKGGLSPKEFLKGFIDKYGDDLTGVVVIGLHKDGEVIDGWSSQVDDEAILWLGAIEQLKIDFWNTLFTKRTDVI